MIVNGGRLFHLSIWRGSVWISLLPDRRNTEFCNRNVPLGWRAWEILEWGGRLRIFRHRGTNEEP